MCGIWAIVNLIKNNKNKDIDKLLSDFWKIQHRGPKAWKI